MPAGQQAQDTAQEKAPAKGPVMMMGPGEQVHQGKDSQQPQHCLLPPQFGFPVIFSP
jgi:hypothetical protein